MKAILALLIAFGLVACTAADAEDKADPIRVLYVTGGGFHDYEAQEALLSEELSERLDIEWTVDFEAGTNNDHKLTRHEDPNWHEDFDAVVYNMCFAEVTDDDYIERLARAHYESGTAAVVLHCAMHTYRDAETDAWDQLVGLSTSQHEHEQREFTIEALDREHPVMAGFPEGDWVQPEDELYIITGTGDNLNPLAEAYGPETDADHVVMWTNTYGNARVVGTTAGHNTEVMEDPVYLDFLENGLRWAVE